MIKMIAGKTGVLVNGIVVPKTKESEPFSSTPEHEARLVDLGLAKYVGEAVGITEDGEITDLPDGVTAIPAYSEETSAKELREIGKLCGLTFKVGMTKDDMVKAIEAAEAALDINAEDEDSEPAPVFDATEAVQ